MKSLFSIWSVAAVLFSSFPSNLAWADKPQLLWDYWYTVTIGSKTHYGYYQEKVELRNSQVLMKNEYWKQEENYINREDLGEVAQNDDALTPLLFNFHSVYRTTEIIIDGTIRDGKFFSARIKKAGKDLPIVERTLPGKTFMSTLFPVWLGKRFANPPPSFKEGASLNFQTFMEDSIDNGFQIQEGTIQWEKPDEFALSTGAVKLLTKISGQPTSIWWVDKKGAALKIEMPDQKVVVNRVSKSVAKKFLDNAVTE